MSKSLKSLSEVLKEIWGFYKGAVVNTFYAMLSTILLLVAFVIIGLAWIIYLPYKLIKDGRLQNNSKSGEVGDELEKEV